MLVSVFINDCPIQLALVDKLHGSISIDSIFLSKNILANKNTSKYKKIPYFFKRLIRVPFELPFRLVWNKLIFTYKRQVIVSENRMKKFHVNNINDSIVLEYIKNKKPGLIVVSATTMVKEDLINAALKINCVILNLHTGVSPYIKGGPSCTNWCLANNYYLIGNTVMTLDKGIDSGAIISTELTELTGQESLYELHKKVFDHGFDLYTRVVSSIVKSKVALTLTPQKEISTDGKLFYTKDWTILKVIQAYLNFLFRYKKGVRNFKLNKGVKLFPFDRDVN